MNVLHGARTSVLTFVALALFVTACGDNPVGDDHNDEHAEATQILLMQGTGILYGYDADDGTVFCSIALCGIEVQLGEEPIVLKVVLLDAEGDDVHIGDLAEEFAFVVDVANPDVATATISTSDDEASLEVDGIAQGTTLLRVALLHGDDHEDLATPPFGDARAVSVRVVGADL